MSDPQAGWAVQRHEPSASRQGSLTLSRLWALVALACIFIILNLTYVHPHDFWWHVRAGQWILENRAIPTTDLFSFTQSGAPWAYQSWLMEVALYLLYRTGGLPLIIFANALVITSAYALLRRVCLRSSGGDLRWAALSMVAAAALILLYRSPRPQSISLLLFSVTLYVLERHARSAGVAGRSDVRSRDRLGKWLLWVLPLLFLLWANAHGGFVFGLALLATYSLARLLSWLRRQASLPWDVAAVTLLSMAATLVTPLGLDIVDYVLGFVRHPVTRTLNVEFWPPTVRTLDGALFFAYVGVLVALIFLSRYRPHPREVLRLLLFGALAVMARRNAVWFGFVAAPVMAACLAGLARKRGSRSGARAGRTAVNLVVLVLVGFLVVLSLPWLRPYLPVSDQRQGYVTSVTPVEAVEFLCDGAASASQPPRVFHTDGTGSYMIWACPEVPVFIDARVELYPEEQWRDYLYVNQVRYDWQAILERYEVDALLIDKDGHETLIGAASTAPGWESVYEDEWSVIFRRGQAP